MKAVFSSVFEEDFAEVVAYYAAEVTPELSVRFENRIIEAVELIGKTPGIGRRRKDLNQPELRSYHPQGFDNYLIFYQVRSEEIFFVRILHGAMDLPAMFPDA